MISTTNDTTASRPQGPALPGARAGILLILAGLCLALATLPAAASEARLVRDIEQLRKPHLPPACPLSPCPLPEPRYGSLPSRIAAFDRLFLFRARDGVHGLEPWISDGTEEGTRLLVDSTPGEGDSSLLPLAAVGGRMVFWAGGGDPDSPSWALWSTDGSAAGTRPLSLPCGEACDARPDEPMPHQVHQGSLYFGAYDEALGHHGIYRTAGGGGAELVHDLCGSPGPCRSRLEELVVWNGELLAVTGWSGEEARAVWAIRGSAVDPVLGDCSRVESLTASGDRLVFFGDCAGGAGSRRGLFALDGLGGAPRFVGDLDGARPVRLLAADGGLFVAATVGPSWNRHWDVWHLDTGASGTSRVTTLDHVAAMEPFGPELLVAGRIEEGEEVTLWAVSSAGGPRQLLDRRVTTSFATAGGKAYFAAVDPAHGTEVWRTDGTPEGTKLLADVNPGPPSSNPTDSGIGMSDFAIVGDLLVFAAHHPEYDIEPWVVPLDAEPPASLCVPDEETLCLGGRFRVTVEWTDFRGGSGPGHAKALEQHTGAFWFFRPQNLEIMVKVLDACRPPWNRYWVFAGGLTSVEVTLRVEDLIAGESREYRNELGSRFVSVQDTDAFDTCP